MKREALGHHKMGRLARRLGIERWGAVGLMESIWALAAKETPRGDLGRLEIEDIAAQIGWSRDPQELIDALLFAHWLDPHPDYTFVIHDWTEHCEDSVHLRLARAKLYFVNGDKPKLTRLPAVERKTIERSYALQSASRTRLSARHAHKSALPSPSPLPTPTPTTTPLPPSVGSAPRLRSARGAEEGETCKNFRKTGEACGMGGSDQDWREGYAELLKLPHSIRLESIRGLTERHSESPNCAELRALPANWVRKRMWTRPIRAPMGGGKSNFQKALEGA